MYRISIVECAMRRESNSEKKAIDTFFEISSIINTTVGSLNYNLLRSKSLVGRIINTTVGSLNYNLHRSTCILPQPPPSSYSPTPPTSTAAALLLLTRLRVLSSFRQTGPRSGSKWVRVSFQFHNIQKLNLKFEPDTFIFLDRRFISARPLNRL